MQVPESRRAAFDAALAELNAHYDPAVRAVSAPFSSPGYHTTLQGGTVHSTRTAFQYALALLDSQEEAWRLRALDVLDGALALQDTDPSNPTYGIWSWFYEEPLSQMSPPDWNWADFCGKELLMIHRFHGGRLPADMLERIRAAVRHACLSIFRRNMHSGYTNISIMGSFVTLCAGETFGWDEILDYGKRRFAKFHAFTLANGAFAEYNSPTYTVVAIEDLTRIQAMVRDEQVQAQVRDMLDVAWRTVAEHFHAPTRQWAGPHARAYQWLQGEKNLALIQLATNGAVRFFDEAALPYDLAWVHLPFHCPEAYHGLFTSCAPHTANCRYGAMDSLLRPVAVPDVATCYVSERFALGSFVRCDTWNQRRNVLAHWGGENTRFLACRLLHDFYDFASGMLTVAQKEGNALVAASLITDGGDTHCNLDMVQNATIRARDLRLRVELGNLEGDLLEENGRIILHDGGLRMVFALVGGSFDGRALAISQGDSSDPAIATALAVGQERRVTPRESRRAYVDVVLYHGEETSVDLSALRDAYAVLALSMGDEPALSEPALMLEDGKVRASIRAGADVLSVVSPAKPVRRARWAAKAYVNGVDLDARED